MFPLMRYDDYANATGIRAATNFRVVTYQPRPSRLLDALNVKYIYATRAELVDNGWLSIKDIGQPQITSEQEGAGRVEYWNIKNWTQPVIQAPAPTGITFQGPLPDVVTLETAIAIHPDDWQGEGVLFEIYTGTPAEPLQNRLFSQVLRPHDNPDHQGWIPVTLTLHGKPPQPTLVSFITQSLGAQSTLAGWADPLIRPGDDFELLYYGPNNLYRNKNYLRRAWVVHQAEEVAFGDTQAVVERLQAPDFDPTVEAVIEGKLPASLGNVSAADVVNIQTYNVSKVVIQTELAEPGLVVLSDIYYPGWKADVDGIEQPIYAANLAMRGVYVPGGRHTLQFVYEPMSLKVGLMISLGMLGLVLAAVSMQFGLHRFRFLFTKQEP